MVKRAMVRSASLILLQRSRYFVAFVFRNLEGCRTKGNGAEKF